MRVNKSSLDRPKTAICIDMGTTNTRAWLVHGNEIFIRRSAPVGVRDTARTGNSELIRATLKELIGSISIEAKTSGLTPALVVGAGMITSSLGLFEIDHVLAPAGAHEIANSMRSVSASDVTDLPIWLASGVRTGSAEPDIAELSELDLIRGEETLCVGLHSIGKLGPESTLLNLGSHWKAITLDKDGRIASSFTTLSGELIRAIQQQTVLSSALPQGRFVDLDLHWLEQGCEQQTFSGLSRALFCTRILEQRFKLTPLQLSSFLLGAVVGSDLAASVKNKKLANEIVITGEGAAVEAWKHLLEAKGFAASICNPATIESAFVAGLLQLATLRKIL